MISTFASGTQTATINTEHFLSSPNVAGKFKLTLDLSNMVAGDYVEIRAYAIAITGGTSRVSWMEAFQGLQSADAVNPQFQDIWNSLTDTNSVRFSLKQTLPSGGGRNFPWRVDKDDALVPTTAGATLDVSATGEAGVDWANVGSPTTVNGLTGTTIATSQVVASVTGAVGSVTARVTANTDRWAGGTIPAPNVTGVPLIDLKYILGTLLTETAGQIAAGFKKLFDVAAPVFTLLSVNQTGDSFARLGTPAGATVSADIATLTDSVSRISIGSSAINTTATAGTTLTTGTAASGSYADTVQLDGVYYQLQDAAGVLDMYFEFNVGTNGVPVEAVLTGRLTTALNSLKVYAYNWGGAAWEQIGTLIGIGTAVDSQSRYDLTTAHVGTGGNLGLVRVRFYKASGLVSANFYVDQILLAYSAVPDNSDVVAIKAKTDQLAFTVANQIDANVLDWKSATAPAMTGDAFARLGSPVNGTISADIAEVEAETDGIAAIPTNPLLTTDVRLNDLDATISSRLATAGYTAPDNADIVAIKSKTDNLPASPAAVSDIPTAAQNADKLLGRSLAAGADGGRTVQDALRILRNKRSIAAGTLTVTKEDDVTSAWTASVATAASDPIDSIDPA